MLAHIIAFETGTANQFDVYYSSRLAHDPLALLPYLDAARNHGSLDRRLVDFDPPSDLRRLSANTNPLLTHSPGIPVEGDDPVSNRSPDPVAADVPRDELDRYVPFDGATMLYLVTNDRVHTYVPVWGYPDVMRPLVAHSRLRAWPTAETPSDTDAFFAETVNGDQEPTFDLSSEDFLRAANNPQTTAHDLLRDHHAFVLALADITGESRRDNTGHWWRDDEWSVTATFDAPVVTHVENAMNEGTYQIGFHVDHTTDWERLVTNESALADWRAEYADIRRVGGQQRLFCGSHLNETDDPRRFDRDGIPFVELTGSVARALVQDFETRGGDERVTAFSVYDGVVEGVRDQEYGG